VGLLLFDGLSHAEETVAASVAVAAPQLHVVGGSAGDDGRLSATHVFCEGEALSDAAVVMVMRVEVPFALLKSEHVAPTDTWLVVTAADRKRRLILEINGKPAVLELARLHGVPVAEVTSQFVATRPFAAMVGGTPYIRSAMAVEGSALVLASAIDEGVVLRLTSPLDLVSTTAGAIARARAQVGQIAGLLAFNCLGRYLEAGEQGLTERLGRVYAAQPVAGFNSYGEQYDAMHVNHTMTGLLFGAGSP
jgi:hypothetical protein